MEGTAQARFEARLQSILIERGMLTREELAEALEQQLILGGQLATNLWELGLVEARVLDSLAGEILSLPVAAPEDVLSAPPALLRRVPRAVVEKAQALPFRMAGRALLVATCRPWDDASLRQVSFAAGRLASPHFLGEAEVMRLSSRLYGVPLSARFRLGRSLPGLRGGGRRSQSPADEQAPDLMPESLFESVYEGQPPGPPAGETQPPPRTPPPDDEILELDEVVEEQAEAASHFVDEEMELDVDLELDEEPDTLHVPIDVEDPAVVPPPEPPAPPPEVQPIRSLQEAVEAMERASSRDELGEVLLRFALGRGKRVALLVRRGGVWFGWLGAGPGVEPSVIPGLMLPAEPGTAFGLVSQTGAPFLGPLAAHPVHDAFLGRLGDEKPGSVGLFPVHHRGRLVFGIYLDGGHGKDLAPDVGELLVLAQRAALTMQKLLEAKLGKR